MHTYIHTYLHAYIHTYIHTYSHTYVCTYTGTCIHIYVYAYIYSHPHYITQPTLYSQPRVGCMQASSVKLSTTYALRFSRTSTHHCCIDSMQHRSQQLPRCRQRYGASLSAPRANLKWNPVGSTLGAWPRATYRRNCVDSKCCAIAERFSWRATR